MAIMLRRSRIWNNSRHIMYNLIRTECVETRKALIFKTHPKDMASRKLGLLETMYHNLHLKGSDVYSEYFEFRTNEALREEEILFGLSMWIKRHPWLRMSVQDNKGNNILDRFHVSEVSEVTSDVLSKVECSEEEEYGEIARDYFRLIMENIHKMPMWRLIQIEPYNSYNVSEPNNQNSNKEFTHRWLLVHHHMMSDGIYIWTLFSDLLFFLKHAQKRSLSLEDIEELPFPPAIEYLLPCVDEAKLSLPLMSSQVRGKVYALDAYESAFSSEIMSLENSPDTTLQGQVNLSCDQTNTFRQLCRQSGSTITGLSLAIVSSAFAKLVKKCLSPGMTRIVIPVVYTVDLRRYLSDRKYTKIFPGCASLHMPVHITINLRDCENNPHYILNTGAMISSEISRSVKNREPVKLFRDIVDHDLSLPFSNKKDPFVLYFTNAMNMDDYISSSQQSSFNLQEFQVLTHVGVENMPIFLFVAWTRGSQFTLKSHAATNYTSVATHSLFISHINEIMQMLMI